MVNISTGEVKLVNANIVQVPGIITFPPILSKGANNQWNVNIIISGNHRKISEHSSIRVFGPF